MAYIVEASYNGGPWRAFSQVLRKDRSKAMSAKKKAEENFKNNRGSRAEKAAASFRIRKVDMRDPVNKTKYAGMHKDY